MTEALYRAVDDRMRADLEEFYSDNRPKVEELRGACTPFSYSMAIHCGLQLAGGFFELDKPINGGRKQEVHWWCVDGLSRIIDLTASQFNSGLNGIKIDEGVTIVNPEDSLYKRYKPQNIKVTKTDQGGFSYALEGLS